eukprot:4349647-Prymnesium_polylepis.2
MLNSSPGAMSRSACTVWRPRCALHAAKQLGWQAWLSREQMRYTADRTIPSFAAARPSATTSSVGNELEFQIPCAVLRAASSSCLSNRSQKARRLAPSRAATSASSWDQSCAPAGLCQATSGASDSTRSPRRKRRVATTPKPLPGNARTCSPADAASTPPWSAVDEPSTRKCQRLRPVATERTRRVSGASATVRSSS